VKTLKSNWFRGRAGRVSKLLIAAIAATALAVGAAACGGKNDESSSGDGSGGSVDVVGYSTPETAYTETLEPGFNDSPDGEGVEFGNSFGASGDQSRAVEAGQPADFVHLALETDVTRLVDAGLVADDWQDAEYDGIIQDSVVVFVVRKGNPEGIETWDDLVSGDVDVVTPNPFTSGGARWNIMAAYGQVVQNGGSDQEGLDFVQQLLENTPIQDASARDALNTFVGGEGDVLLSYENEAIAAQDAGEDVEYIVPDDTILIETPGAVTEDPQDPDAAQAFHDYLISEDGQRGWAENGFRPVDPKVLKEFQDDFPEPSGLFNIDDLGGWETIATDFFDPENGSVAAIEADLGVSTE
jgi:sulfate transport system substrate-binding protein